VKAMVVTQDPAFMASAQLIMRAQGEQAVWCLDSPDPSWLPAEVGIAIVDAPPSGSFASPGAWPPGPGDEVPVAHFADELADRHPGLMVVMCNVPEGAGGPSGGVACVDRQGALDLLSTTVRHSSGATRDAEPSPVT
jgi:hypothetical protein